MIIIKNAEKVFHKIQHLWGSWVASAKCLTLAPGMISQFLGSSPTSDSVLTAQSLKPVLDSVSLSLSLPLPRSCFSISQKLINIKKN